MALSPADAVAPTVREVSSQRSTSYATPRSPTNAVAATKSLDLEEAEMAALDAAEAAELAALKAAEQAEFKAAESLSAPPLAGSTNFSLSARADSGDGSGGFGTGTLRIYFPDMGAAALARRDWKMGWVPAPCIFMCSSSLLCPALSQSEEIN